MRHRHLIVPIVAALFILGGLFLGCSSNEPPSRPNVLIVLVDALRADHLGCYGYERPTSPFLDEFAEQGVLFANAFSQSSQTKPSVASLMAGLNPPSHHVRTVADLGLFDVVVADVLSEDAVTLAERLGEAGYMTAGFVTNPHLEASQGFGQGFDHYVYTPFGATNAKGLNESVVAWLDEPREAPWFTYVHYMDVHTPYRPVRPYNFRYTREMGRSKPFDYNGPARGPVEIKRLGRTVGLYDGQINYWDDRFKELIGVCEERGWLENTLVVMLSDHGDEFYEHGGFGHGYTVYDGVIHVPLVMTWDKGLPRSVRREDLVRVIDILPTICGLTGVPVEATEVEGRDLFADDAPEPGTIEVYAEAVFGLRPRSVRFEDRHLVNNSTDETWEYYDLETDPFQQVDVYGQGGARMEDLRTRLARLRAGTGTIEAPAPVTLDDETVEALKSLGYVQ